MAVASPRASQRAFDNVQQQLYGNWQELLARKEYGEVIRQLIDWVGRNADVVHGAMLGKLNAVGTVTLATSAATTTLKDPRIGVDTVVICVPTTANAMTEVGDGTGPYQDYPNTTEGQAVLNHANSATADRTFAYALIG